MLHQEKILSQCCVDAVPFDWFVSGRTKLAKRIQGQSIGTGVEDGLGEKVE